MAVQVILPHTSIRHAMMDTMEGPASPTIWRRSAHQSVSTVRWAAGDVDVELLVVVSGRGGKSSLVSWCLLCVLGTWVIVEGILG